MPVSGQRALSFERVNLNGCWRIFPPFITLWNPSYFLQKWNPFTLVKKVSSYNMLTDFYTTYKSSIFMERRNHKKTGKFERQIRKWRSSHYKWEIGPKQPNLKDLLSSCWRLGHPSRIDLVFFLIQEHLFHGWIMCLSKRNQLIYILQSQWRKKLPFFDVGLFWSFLCPPNPFLALNRKVV